jgi:hypothetical protein
MPRNDWSGDDYMTRDRDYRDLEGRERGYDRDRGAFFQKPDGIRTR